MATDLGQAYVQIMPSAKGFAKKMKEELGGEMPDAGKSAGISLGNNLVGAIVGIVAAAKIGQMITDGIKASLNEGAALQQSMGGVETLFKNNAGIVKKYADEAYKTTGLSANAYMENVTGFSASLLQSLGGDTAKAANVANMAMIDMADNSNKMGTSMESIQYAYQGFAKQNYTMLDNLKLGYGGTKSEMERLLADAEKLTGKKYDMSNLSDVYEAIHAIQKQMGITGTTAKEAEHTFTGSLSAMKASASNLLGKLALGEDIKPSLEQLASTTSTFLFNNFLPMVGNILKGLPTVIGGLLQEVGPMFLEKGQELVNNLGQGMTGGVGTIIGNIVKAFSPLGEALQTVFGQIPQLIETVISQISPIITSIGTTLGQLKFDGIKNFIEAIIPALNAGFKAFMGVAGPAITQVVEAFKNLWNTAQPLISILGEALMPIFEILGSFLGGVLKGALMAVSGLFDMLAIAIEWLTPVIDFLVKALEFVTPVLKFVAEWVGVAIGLFANFGSSANGLKGMMSSAWTNIKNVISTAKNIITGAINILKGGFNGFGAVGKTLKNTMKTVWDAIVGSIRNAKETIKGIIDSIKNIFDSLKNINLADAGNAIMNSFLGGLKKSWEGVTDFVGGIAGWIKDNKGPIEYDRKLLIPAGNAIMDGLNKGLRDNFKNVKSTVSGMADELQNAFGIPQLATDMPVNMNGQIASQLSSQKLAHQVSNTPQNELSNFDLYNMINKISNRQIVVSAQFKENEFARMVAQPIDKIQARKKTTLARMRGEIT